MNFTKVLIEVVPSRQLTCSPIPGTFEDLFPLPKLGYVSSPEGRTKHPLGAHFKFMPCFFHNMFP